MAALLLTQNDKACWELFFLCFLLSINFTLLLYLPNYMFFLEILTVYLNFQLCWILSLPEKNHYLCLNPWMLLPLTTTGASWETVFQRLLASDALSGRPRISFLFWLFTSIVFVLPHVNWRNRIPNRTPSVICLYIFICTIICDSGGARTHIHRFPKSQYLPWWWIQKALYPFVLCFMVSGVSKDDM